MNHLEFIILGLIAEAAFDALANASYDDPNLKHALQIQRVVREESFLRERRGWKDGFGSTLWSEEDFAFLDGDS